MMAVKIRRSTRHDYVTELDAECFPSDDRFASEGHDLWLAITEDGTPLAYATGRVWHLDNWYQFTRCGVSASARGNGLQQRLIRARLAHAKRIGCKGAYTYTLPDNRHSSNNLIAAGFRLWRPAYRWGGANALYWQKSFP